jgi:hypothetical protein
VGFVVDKVALEQVLPCKFHSTGTPLFGKMEKLIIFLFIFITGLHNKPQGCGASVASASGPFTTKKESGHSPGCTSSGSSWHYGTQIIIF